MGLWEHFPYTNFHGLNLDWVLEKIKELQDRIEDLEKRIEDLKKEILDEVDQKLQEFEEKLLQEVQEKLDALKQELTELIDQKIIEAVTEINNKISTLETKVDKLREDFDKCCTEVKASIAAIENRLSTVETRLDNIDARIANIVTAITEIQNDIRNLTVDINDMQASISTIRSDILTIQTEIANIKVSINSIQTDVSNLQTTVTNHDNRITALEGEYDDLKSTVDQHTTEITQLQGNYTNLDKIVTQHTAQITNHENRITALENAGGGGGGLIRYSQVNLNNSSYTVDDILNNNKGMILDIVVSTEVTITGDMNKFFTFIRNITSNYTRGIVFTDNNISNTQIRVSNVNFLNLTIRFSKHVNITNSNIANCTIPDNASNVSIKHSIIDHCQIGNGGITVIEYSEIANPVSYRGNALRLSYCKLYTNTTARNDIFILLAFNCMFDHMNIHADNTVTTINLCTINDSILQVEDARTCNIFKSVADQSDLYVGGLINIYSSYFNRISYTTNSGSIHTIQVTLGEIRISRSADTRVTLSIYYSALTIDQGITTVTYGQRKGVINIPDTLSPTEVSTKNI